MKSCFDLTPAFAPAGDNDSGAGSGGVAGTLGQAKQTVTQAARETASKIKATASDTATKAREEAARLADEKKEQTARRVDNYGSALHESARSLESDDPNIAWFTHRMADRLQGAADYVRQRDWSALRTDAENMARRHPAAFFGGMFVAGLVLGNVLKASSSPGANANRDRENWDRVSGDEGMASVIETDFEGEGMHP